MRTSPLLGGKMPARMRMVVVLPAPFGPRKPTISPTSTRNEMPRTASTAPKVLVRSRTSIIAWPMPLPAISNPREQLRGEIVQVREAAGGAGEVVVEGQVARQGDRARPGGERAARTRAGGDARAQQGRVDARLPRPELVGADRQRVGPAGVLGAEATRDPVAPVLLEPDVDAELTEHASVRLPLQALGVGDHTVQIEDDAADHGLQRPGLEQ